MKFIKRNLIVISIVFITLLLLIFSQTFRKSAEIKKEKKLKSLSVVENDVVILTLTFSDKSDLFSHETLRKIYSLNLMLEKMEGIKNIASLAGATIVTAEKDEILVKPFVPAKLFKEKNDRQSKVLMETYAQYPELRPYISSDLRSVSFYIEPGMKYSSYKLFEQLEDIQEHYKELYGFTFEFTGFRPVKVVIEKYLTEDILYFLPVILLFIIVLFYVNFSSFRVIGLSFFIIVISSLGAYGAAMALDFKITPLIVLVPAFNAGLLTDYLLHFFYHTRGLGTNGEIKERRNRLIMPLLLTAVSTAIGFLSMMLLSSEGHQFLGLFTALCIVLTYILTVLWLPDIISTVMPSSHGLTFKNRNVVLEKIRIVLFGMFYFFMRYKKAVYISCAAFVVLSFAFIPRIIIQPYPVHQIPEKSTVRKAEKILNSQFAGTIPFSIHVDAKESQALLKRSNLLNIEQIHARLSKNKDVGYNYSFITIIKRINFYFNNSQPDQERIPVVEDEFQFQSLIEQYLIFYSTTASPQEYESLMDPGYRLFAINGVMKYSSHESLNNFMKTIAGIRSQMPAGWKLEVKGPMKQLLNQSSSLRNNWIFSFVISLVLIFLTVLIFYKDLKLSLVSLFPSLLSIVITTGFIALFNIEIDIYTIIFTAITMGLSIDYTIHVIVAVNELKETPGMENVSVDDREAVKKYLSYIISHSGVPVFLSFLTSLFSFGILLLSSFEGARNFGLIISLSLVISIIFSVIILPALLLKTGKRPVADG